MCLNLQLRVNLMCTCCPSGIVDMETKAHLWNISLYTYIGPFSSWIFILTVLFLANSAYSNFVSTFFVYGRSTAQAGTLIMKSALMVRKLLVFTDFSLNTTATPFYNCNLTWKMTHKFNSIIIIGGLHAGDFVH